MEKVKIHGCTLGVRANQDPTKPIKKQWTTMTNLEELKESLRDRRCPGNHEDVHCAGKYTKNTGHYPKKIAHLIHRACEVFWLKGDQESIQERIEVKVKTIQENIA